MVGSLIAAPFTLAGTPANWTAPTDGLWADPTRWSTNPYVPDNGTPTGVNYDAQIGGGNFTVTLDRNVSVDSLTLSGGATLAFPRLDVNSHLRLSISGDLTIDGPATSIALRGGIIDGARLTTPNGGSLQLTVGNETFSNDYATLENVYVDGAVTLPASGRLRLHGATTLGPNARIAVPEGSHLDASPSLTGAGEVIFDRYSAYLSTPSIGAGVTVRTALGGAGIFESDVVNNGRILAETGLPILLNGVTNGGTIHAANGGTIGLGPFTNTGSITADTGGTIQIFAVPAPADRGVFRIRDGGLTLTGNISTADVRALDVANSTITISPDVTHSVSSKLLNSGATLYASDGTNTWRLSGGDISGGTIAASARPLAIGAAPSWATSTITGARVESSLDLEPGARLQLPATTVASGATIRLISDASRYASLNLGPTTTLEPGVRFTFDGAADTGWITGPGPANWKLPAGIEVVTAGAGGRLGNFYADPWASAGLISSRTAGRTLTLTGAFTNAGTLEAISGGDLVIADPAPVGPHSKLRNDGTLRLGAGGDVLVNGPFSHGPTGTLRVDIGGRGDEDYGQLRATAATDLAGTLAVSLAQNFSPAPLDTFIVLQYPSATGRFTTYDSLDIPGPLVLAPVYTSTTLKLVATLPGDADLNGAVDFQDLTRLAQSYNVSGTTWDQGDFNADGRTDFSDLIFLAQHYNQAAPAGSLPDGFQDEWRQALAAAPEPGASLTIVLLGAGMLARVRRSRAL